MSGAYKRATAQHSKDERAKTSKFSPRIRCQKNHPAGANGNPTGRISSRDSIPVSFRIPAAFDFAFRDMKFDTRVEIPKYEIRYLSICGVDGVLPYFGPFRIWALSLSVGDFSQTAGEPE